MNPVLATTLFVVKKAQDVTINRKKVNALGERWTKQKITVPAWPRQYHLQTENRRVMLDYLILLDALNFCFWSKKEKWHITYRGKRYDGYFALALSLKKFFEENPEKANLLYFAAIPFKEFCAIVAGEGELLLLKKRWQIARAIGGAVRGNAEGFLRSAHNQCSLLVPKIAKLPSFDDTATYQGKRIHFLKRAQILVSDIWGAEIERFDDVEYLCAFADYKIPQILFHMGILEYSASLEKKIAQRTLIPKGSGEEIEIRSCTIWAVEYLKDALKLYGRKLYSLQIDWLLWNKSQETNMPTPYHLTKTIYY